MPSLSKLTNIERRLNAIGQVSKLESDPAMAAFLADPEQVELMRQSLIGSLSSGPNGMAGWAPDMSEEQATAYVDKLSPQQVVVRYEQRCWSGQGALVLHQARKRVTIRRAYRMLAAQLSTRQLTLLEEHNERPYKDRHHNDTDEGAALHRALDKVSHSVFENNAKPILPDEATYYVVHPERTWGRYEWLGYPIERRPDAEAKERAAIAALTDKELEALQVLPDDDREWTGEQRAAMVRYNMFLRELDSEASC